VDLCGFTAFAEHQGDTRVVLVLADMRAGVREMCARRGVRIVKWLGDGAMLSSTMTHNLIALVVELNDQTRRLQPELAVRAGLDAGPVVMFEGDDYIGRPVNRASRLCDLAGPGMALCTKSVLPDRPPWVDVVPAGMADLRGVDEPIEMFHLLVAPDKGDGVVDPVCGLTIPRAAALSVPDDVNGGSGPLWFCSEACAGAWEG
jgi:class 3 adenylate cyclase/YHS domain-containing protein